MRWVRGSWNAAWKNDSRRLWLRIYSGIRWGESRINGVPLLSVPVSGSIVRDLQRGFFTEPLDEYGGVSLTALLAEIHQKLAFEDLDDEELQNHLAVGSPADTLWKAITKISPTRN